jgi:hypothetical protein
MASASPCSFPAFDDDKDTGEWMAMERHIGQFVCFLLLLLLSGCKGQGLPADPLFANRKPLESKRRAGPPLDTPYREPTPP